MRNSHIGLKHSEITKQKMSEAKKGKISNNFKGKTKDSNGYILIYSPDHSYKNYDNNVFEHRLIVEAQIGRYLLPTEIVHHINGIRDDNHLENLMCFTSRSTHNRYHKDPNNIKDNEIIFDGRKLNEKK